MVPKSPINATGLFRSFSDNFLSLCCCLSAISIILVTKTWEFYLFSLYPSKASFRHSFLSFFFLMQILVKLLIHLVCLPGVVFRSSDKALSFPSALRLLVLMSLRVQSWPTLCSPTDCSPPDSSVHGVSQKRVLECLACPPAGIFPIEGSNPGLLHWQVDFLSLEPPWKPEALSTVF